MEVEHRDPDGSWGRRSLVVVTALGVHLLQKGPDNKEGRQDEKGVHPKSFFLCVKLPIQIKIGIG